MRTRIIIASLVAASTVAFAPDADAVRVSADYKSPDVCHNVPGKQTINDVRYGPWSVAFKRNRRTGDYELAFGTCVRDTKAGVR